MFLSASIHISFHPSIEAVLNASFSSMESNAHRLRSVGVNMRNISHLKAMWKMNKIFVDEVKRSER